MLRVSKSIQPIVRRNLARAYVTTEDKFDTIAIHGGYTPDQTNSCALPIYRTSSYVFNSTEHASNLFALKELGNIYTRIMNPTQAMLETRLAMLDKGAASVALASGQCASFYSTLNLCRAGDNILTGRNLYGGTYTLFEHLLPSMGIETRFFDSNNPEEINKLTDSKTRGVFCRNSV